MANQTALFFNLFLLLSFLFLVSIAESRSITFGFAGEPTLQCESVYGVASGDTCVAITQKFQLTNEIFASINPNINCNALFVAQWVCISGSIV